MRCSFTNDGNRLPVPKVVDSKPCKKYQQVAIPQVGQDIVEPALVGLGFVLVFFSNAYNILTQVKNRYGDAG